MNHYEELGIEREATTAEIREVYKLAARLLHPDMHTDPRLKELAECQMRRLSEVAAMLVNPRERARYDAALAGETRARRFRPPTVEGGLELRQTAVRHWFWILLGSTALGMGVWYGLAQATDPAARIAAAENAAVPGSPVRPLELAKNIAKSASAPKESHTTWRHMVAEAPAPIERVAPIKSATVPAESTHVEDGARPVAREARRGEAVRSGVESRFAGQWLFAADTAGEDRAGAYPAKYVELLLREERGRLAGEYRAIYSRLDKAISPEVVFRVRGDLPQGSAGSMEWESNAGAQGELELTLQAPDRLLVKWWTTRFGRQEVLSSGMANLMRLEAR